MKAGETAPAPRSAPLDGPALRAALLDGVRLYCRENGTPLPGDAERMVEHQLAAVRRAAKRVDPHGVRTRPPMHLAAPEPDAAEQPKLPWWKRD